MAFCVELNRKAAARPVTEEWFYEILDRNKQDIDNYRASHKASIKRGLPGWIFQSESFIPHEKVDKKGNKLPEDTWRDQEYSLLNGLFMVDLDHVENPRKLYEEQIAKDDQLKRYKIRLVFITPGGEGLKIVAEADPEIGNLASNILWLSDQLGVTPDLSTIDASRLSFASTREDILFIDHSIFNYKNEAYAQKYNEKYHQGLSQPDGYGKDDAANQTDNGKPQDAKAQVATQVSHLTSEEIENYKYEDFTIPEIINAYLEGKAPTQGKRHDTLLTLASDLRHVTENSRDIIYHNVSQLTWVKDIVKRGEDVGQTVDDAMKYKYAPYMPKKMEKALKALGMKLLKDSGEMDPLKSQFLEFGMRIEELAQHFPVIKMLIADNTTVSHASTLFVAAALYGTLATRTWYRFYHNPHKERRLNYAIYIIADPANGKSFAEELYELLMEPIKMSDRLGNDAINHFKKALKERQTSTKEQKKDALQIPDTKVRIHGTRTANGVFIEDMVACSEVVNGKLMHLHLFTFDSELDAATAASKGGQWIDKSIFELKAFHNEEDNQQYKNVDAVNGSFNVFWNFVYTGTPLSLDKKVTERNFGTGLFSRLAVIPLCNDNFEMMPLKELTKSSMNNREKLREWAYKMDKVQGELPLWELVKVTWSWTNEQMKIAKIEQDNKLALLCRRVAHYGMNIAAPFVLMRHWDEWEKSRTLTIDEHDKELCMLVMDIQFFSQKYFFGKYAEMYYDNKNQDANNKCIKSGVKVQSYYDSLPVKFSIDEMIERLSISNENARVICHRWVREGLVKKSGRGKSASYAKK